MREAPRPAMLALPFIGGTLLCFLAFLSLQGFGFGSLRLLAWGVFVHFPLFLFGVMLLLYRQRRDIAILNGILAVALLLIGLDAFLIEPHWLQVTRRTITSPKLTRPVRVALLADIQTDTPGPYEARVLREVKKANPDLILFAGDYLAPARNVDDDQLLQRFRRILRQADLSAPLGMYAIDGNVRLAGTAATFAGLPVEVMEETGTRDLGPLALTGLSLLDSANSSLRLSGQRQFHLVVGHVPNYALGQVGADLLLAGHTHGGQVQLPGIGPLMTLCEVPRRWASGLTEIAPGKHLLVSRGIGMERNEAPRLRFLCRPELAIIDLQPAGEPASHR
ncbi:MAG: metallophosphoesterase [Armatimonadota bacterium]